MHNRVSIACLVFLISISACYGHAANFQIKSLNVASPSTTGASSMTSLISHTALLHKERRSDSVPAPNNDSGLSPLKRHRKKCAGVKSRYCRSYHRKLQQKLDMKVKLGSVESASVAETTLPLMAPKIEAPPAPEIEAPPAAKIEAPPAHHIEAPPATTAEASPQPPTIDAESPEMEVKASVVEAVIPKIEVETPKVEVSVTNHNAEAKLGDATYYGTGLGACGIVSSDYSMIAAASRLLFDTFPGATANPNLNPICGRKVRATYQGNSVEVELVDRCEGCAMFDLDFSPTAFARLGAMERGRLHGMTWEWI